MSTMAPDRKLDRRGFLGAAGLAGAATALSGRALAASDKREPDPLIMETLDSSRYLGVGVDKRPYGKPSPYESHVVRRDVSWLTASAESSVNFTPLHELEGIITPFLATPRRSSGGWGPLSSPRKPGP